MIVAAALSQCSECNRDKPELVGLAVVIGAAVAGAAVLDAPAAGRQLDSDCN